MTVRTVALSLERTLIEKIDVQRGYESRSHFVQRLIEKSLNKEGGEAPRSSPPTYTDPPASRPGDQQ